MISPEDKYELFERKISNQLSVEEEKVLSQLIEDDAVIAEEFDLYKELNSHVETSLNSKEEEANLEQNLKKIGSAFFDKKTSKKEFKVIKMPVWMYAAAASVAIIIGIYTFAGNNPSYNDFASIPELSIVERGGEEALIKSAETSFNAKEYTSAEKYLSELLLKDSDNSIYLFYYGISLLEQNKYVEATRTFQKIQQGNSIYKYKAIWFEALNQLKQKEQTKCVELLREIPDDAEDYQQAKELLKKL